MFDIGMSELLLIGIVALIVVGPKDLPGMFRTLGRFTAKARSLGREFNRAMNEAAKESGVQDVANTLKTATSPKSMGLDALNKAADSFEKWEPTKTSSKGKAPAAELSEDRAEAARKIQDATAKKATERLEREAAEAAAEKTAEAAKPAAKKPAARKPAAAKPAAKKPAAAKPAPKKKPAAKKTGNSEE